MSNYPLDIIEIQASLDAIKQDATSDPENAHSIEDDMYYRFSLHIAGISFIPNKVQLALLKDKAKLVLSSKEIQFTRSCS